MRISDRLSKLEGRGNDAASRSAINADAAEFMRRIGALASRARATATLADFTAGIRTSGDPFLIAIFLGDHHAHR